MGSRVTRHPKLGAVERWTALSLNMTLRTLHFSTDATSFLFVFYVFENIGAKVPDLFAQPDRWINAPLHPATNPASKRALL